MTGKNNKIGNAKKISYILSIDKLKKELEDKEWIIRKTDTALKALYRELKRKNEKLEKLNQSKSDFVSITSHELRAPLSIIKESINLVLEKVGSNMSKEQKELLIIAENNADRLARIVSNLLDISKIEAGKVELKKSFINFSSMIKDICARWKLEFSKKRQALRLSLPKKPVNVYIDPDRITEVMNNFISNAVKYTLPGGKIEVELKNRRNKIELSVSDTGVGIAEENLPKVFSKFQRFPRTSGENVQGTGLGMAIAKEIVEMHQGSIKVESKINKGSRFSFSLPHVNSGRVLREYIDSKIKTADNDKFHLSLMVIHIHGFSRLQDESGYEKAYEFLENIKKMIRDSLRRGADTITICIGELTLILADTSIKEAEIIKKRIERTANIYLSMNKDRLLQSINIAINHATYPEEASNSKELLDKAKVLARMENKK